MKVLKKKSRPAAWKKITLQIFQYGFFILYVGMIALVLYGTYFLYDSGFQTAGLSGS